MGLATDPASRRLYVAESVRDVYELGPRPAVYGSSRIQIYDRNAKCIAAFPVQRPDAMAIGAHGDLYLATDQGIQIYARRKNSKHL